MKNNYRSVSSRLLTSQSTTLHVAENDVKAGGSRAVVETGFVIVRVGISRWAIAVDESDIVGVDDESSAALIGPDWWSWATEVDSGMFQFVTSHSEWVRIVPALAWRQAHDFATVAGN